MAVTTLAVVVREVFVTLLYAGRLQLSPHNNVPAES